MSANRRLFSWWECAKVNQRAKDDDNETRLKVMGDKENEVKKKKRMCGRRQERNWQRSKSMDDTKMLSSRSLWGSVCCLVGRREREREREEELLKELSVPFALSRRTLFLQLRLPRLYRPPLLQNLPTPPTHTHPSPSTVPPSTLSRLLLLLVSSVGVCAVPPPSKKKKKKENNKRTALFGRF